MRKKLKDLRLERGIRPTEMAKRLGVTYPFYYLIEQGKRGVTLEKAVSICAILQIQFDYSVFDNQ